MIGKISQHRPEDLISAFVVFFFCRKISGAAIGVAAQIKQVIMQNSRGSQGKFAHQLIGDTAKTAIAQSKVLYLGGIGLYGNSRQVKAAHLRKPRSARPYPLLSRLPPQVPEPAALRARLRLRLPQQNTWQGGGRAGGGAIGSRVLPAGQFRPPSGPAPVLNG